MINSRAKAAAICALAVTEKAAEEMRGVLLESLNSPGFDAQARELLRAAFLVTLTAAEDIEQSLRSARRLN
jgi:hypothetical protein